MAIIQDVNRISEHRRIIESMAKGMGKSFLPPGESGIKRKYLEHVPFMSTDDGTVICIPKLPEMGGIALIGQTGTGKTLAAGYILDNLYYLWKDYIAVLNDSQDETFTWSEPCDNPEFIFRQNYFHQTPMPLPMIYLLPNSDSFEINEEVIKDKNTVKISIPFEAVMNNIENFIPDLGNSERYLLAKKDELLNVESEAELFQVIDTLDSGSKGMLEVKNKIEKSFRNLLNEGILNLSNITVPSYLKVGEYHGNPFTAVMKAECIPSFITSDLYTQKHKDAIMSYYINELFEESKGGAMKGTRTWLYFDELTKVVHADPQFTSPQSEKALNNVASRGRNNGISLIYATQRYGEIPKTIRDQTKFVIAFRHKNADETKSIQDDFGVEKTVRNNILTLRKFECVALTTEYFICYKDNDVWEDKGPFIGKIIPSLHKNKFLSELKK